jgi:hypothetical protein
MFRRNRAQSFRGNYGAGAKSATSSFPRKLCDRCEIRHFVVSAETLRSVRNPSLRRFRGNFGAGAKPVTSSFPRKLCDRCETRHFVVSAETMRPVRNPSLRRLAVELLARHPTSRGA